jgi:hypothetical protein
MDEYLQTSITSEPLIPRLRAARRLAWTAWSISLLLILAALIISFLSGGHLLKLLNNLLTSIVFACFGTVGALIVTQRPKNTIGWLFCIVGIGTGITDFSGAYSSYGAIHGHVLPGSAVFNWLGNTVWPLNWGLFLVFLPLLFPTGRALTRRWRIVGWLAGVMILLAVLAGQASAITGALSGSASVASNWDNVSSTINLLELPLAVAALASLVLRFMRANARERRQIKWFAYGVTIMVVLIGGGVLILQNDNGQYQYLFDIALLCLPLSVGISILRAQLYDIDRLINRTLVYGVLTGILVGIYAGLVIGVQALFLGVTGGSGGNNTVVLVGSTLAVAGLFQPLRSRIQYIIDRRFYRRKYDAAQTLVAFSATLRSEVELNELREHLLAVVQETLQPAHVSLWLSKVDYRRNNTWNGDDSHLLAERRA